MKDELLEEISLQDVPFLLETLQKNPSKYYPLIQYITIHKEYQDDNIEDPKQTLLRYGSVEDGVYVLESIFSNKGTPYTNLFIYTASEDLTSLRSLLTQTSRIPWYTSGYSIQLVFKNVAQVVHEVAKLKGVNFKSAVDFMMWLPPEISLSVSDVPENLELRYLNSNHVQQVTQNWPHKFNGCEFYLEQQIKNNFGLGLFRKSDNKMMASALSFHSGGIFVLFTDPEFRGKGYAEIIVQNMTKELLRRGRTPFATVRKENTPSVNLFKKVGFQVLDEVEHIYPESFRKF